ncbi:MAG: ASKHA domain-containing protein, partial [Planctomycetota bacterium]
IILGMLPDLPEERYSYLGNTSVAGAYLTLLSPELRAEAEDVASMMTYIELSVSRGFMDEYMSSMFLPHTDLQKFPTVAELLKKR